MKSTIEITTNQQVEFNIYAPMGEFKRIVTNIYEEDGYKYGQVKIQGVTLVVCEMFEGEWDVDTRKTLNLSK